MKGDHFLVRLCNIISVGCVVQIEKKNIKCIHEESYVDWTPLTWFEEISVEKRLCMKVSVGVLWRNVRYIYIWLILGLNLLLLFRFTLLRSEMMSEKVGFHTSGKKHFNMPRVVKYSGNTRRRRRRRSCAWLRQLRFWPAEGSKYSE